MVYKICLVSLSINAILLICLFSPNIAYFFNKKHLIWKDKVKYGKIIQSISRENIQYRIALQKLLKRIDNSEV